MRRTAYDLEIFRKTATWAEQIVSKDQKFQDYAGAPLDIGDQIVCLDLFCKYFVSDERIKTIFEIFREYLIEKKKAYFAGVLANQISMLAFLRGGKVEELDAILNRAARTETG